MKKFTLSPMPGITLGALFLVSGFVKAIDPVGLSYKMEEYFGMFQLASWNTLSTFFAVALCAAEVALGLMLLLKLFPRITALATTIFILLFSIVTYLIYTDPYGGVTECGCFGDAIHLSNGATFGKNIVFLIIAAVHQWIVFRQSKIKNNRFDYRKAYVSVGVILLSFSIPLYSLWFLPPFDFLPFNRGIHILNNMNSDTETHQKANYLSKFVVMDTDGKDHASEVFDNSDYNFIIISRDIDYLRDVDFLRIAPLYELHLNKSINLYLFTSSELERAEETLSSYGLTDVKVYNVDEVVLKSMMRNERGVILVSGGVISGKWNLKQNYFKSLNNTTLSAIVERERTILLKYTITLLLLVAVLFLCVNKNRINMLWKRKT